MENKILEALKYASVIIAESSHKNNAERTECYNLVLEAIEEIESKEQPDKILDALETLYSAEYFVGPIWTRGDILMSIIEDQGFCEETVLKFTEKDIEAIRESIETRLAKHGEGLEWDLINEEVRNYAQSKGWES